MFCPKCGTQAIEGTKFCRGCGTDLEPVSQALTGKIALSSNQIKSLSKKERKELNGEDEHSNDPDKLWNSFISNGLIGLAFVIIAIFLTLTGTIGGNVWGFWLLIPGAGCLGSSIASYFKAQRIERRLAAARGTFQNAALPPPTNFNTAFPPTQQQNLPPQPLFGAYTPPARNTGELMMPPSVTEHTTRHLQIDSENETINLPQQK